MVPDKPDGTNYTKEEAEEIIIQKYNKEFTQEDVMVSNRPEQVENITTNRNAASWHE